MHNFLICYWVSLIGLTGLCKLSFLPSFLKAILFYIHGRSYSPLLNSYHNCSIDVKLGMMTLEIIGYNVESIASI